MERFAHGDFLPVFQADSSINPAFDFDVLSGHRCLLVFVASARSDIGRAVAETVAADIDWLTAQRIYVYLVTGDRRDREDGRLARLSDRIAVFWDFDRTIHRLYGMEVAAPGGGAGGALRAGAFLMRPNRRLHATIAASPAADLGGRVRAAVESLPPAEPARPMTGAAPVLVIPEVVDPAYCRRLIDRYEIEGGTDSGFMRDVGDQTRGLRDAALKRRKDWYIDDPELLKPLRRALETRVLPEIEKAFAYRVTRVERYLVGCYDAADKGFFTAHRDNTSKATAHRRFALSLNLNSEEFEGGALRFPEYGPHTYKPPTGGAVVFSCSLMHEALPVTRGRRYVVLPFLYDDRGAAIRAANQRYLESGQTPAERPA